MINVIKTLVTWFGSTYSSSALCDVLKLPAEYEAHSYIHYHFDGMLKSGIFYGVHLGNHHTIAVTQNRRPHTVRSGHLYISSRGALNPVVASIRRLTYLYYYI